MQSDDSSRRMNINTSSVNIRENSEECEGQSFRVLAGDIPKMSQLVWQVFI